MPRLSAPLGVYAVLGNHDHGVHGQHTRAQRRESASALRDVLGAGGVRELLNESVLISRDGCAPLHLAGFGDLWAGEFDPEAVTAVSTGPTIALTHNPDGAPALAERDMDLILCGHTHGGQVRVPFLGPPILPVRLRQYAAGPYDLDRSRLYVNRGVGWLRRVRLFVRPEVTLHMLRA